MSKNRPKTAQPPQSGTPASAAPPQKPAPRKKMPGSGPNLVVRILLSIFVVWHVFAVFMAPLSLPPTSQFVSDLVQGTVESPSLMQWYLDALYLNHGYHFFAPSPGPGHIIRYRLTDAQGREIEEGEFPDRRVYWPRLRYHRHFMLSDQTESLPLLQITPDGPRQRTPEEVQRLVLQAYARHLLREHDAAEARLTRVRHYMLSPIEKRDGIKLDAPHKYETQMEVVQRASDLPQPNAEVENVLQNLQSSSGTYSRRRTQ